MMVRLLLPLLLAATPVVAQDVAPAAAPLTGDVVALSPYERAAVLDHAARTKDLPINGAPDRKIHGEMGIEVDSRGGHALYGTTVVPIGQTGTAAFSFLTANSGNNGRRWH